MIIYVVTVIIKGGLNTVVREFPTLRQLVTNFDEARLAVLYLLLRRFYRPAPQWGFIAVVVGFEVTMGITDLCRLSRAAGADRPGHARSLRLPQRPSIGGCRPVAVVTVGFGLVWIGIRSDYRRQYVQMDNFRTDRGARIARIGNLASGFLGSDAEDFMATVDTFVDRMWPIYYPALAVSRVRAVLPHTDGAIFATAIRHITMPRIFFPDKDPLLSDSEMVRSSSGVLVAGDETGTTIALGYAAESYLDFGLPWMFLPVFGFALVMGVMYRVVARSIKHRELLVAYTTVTFWFALFLFERSWPTALGEALGLLVYVGGPMVLLDRLLLTGHVRDRADRALLFP